MWHREGLHKFVCIEWLREGMGHPAGEPSGGWYPTQMDRTGRASGPGAPKCSLHLKRSHATTGPPTAESHLRRQAQESSSSHAEDEVGGGGGGGDGPRAGPAWPHSGCWTPDLASCTPFLLLQALQPPPNVLGQ